MWGDEDRRGCMEKKNKRTGRFNFFYNLLLYRKADGMPVSWYETVTNNMAAYTNCERWVCPLILMRENKGKRCDSLRQKEVQKCVFMNGGRKEGQRFPR